MATVELRACFHCGESGEDGPVFEHRELRGQKDVRVVCCDEYDSTSWHNTMDDAAGEWNRIQARLHEEQEQRVGYYQKERFQRARGRRDWRKWERRGVRVRTVKVDGEWAAYAGSNEHGPYMYDGPSAGESVWGVRQKWRNGVCRWVVRDGKAVPRG